MRRSYHYFLFLILFTLILTGCGVSEEEALTAIETMLEPTFEQVAPKATKELKAFNIYLPEGFTVEEEFDNNVILNNHDQTYILFYNLFEEQDSDFFYQLAKQAGDYALLETFQDNDRFGYVKVEDMEDHYEVQVGIGGMRLTTHTSLKQIEDDVANMITMLNSVE